MHPRPHLRRIPQHEPAGSLRVLGLVALAVAACAGGCRKQEVIEASEAIAVPASKPPVDRLAKGELGRSKQQVFGFSPPEKLRLDAAFRDAAHLSGNVDPVALAEYVKEQVTASHVELAGNRTLFHKARIKGGDPARTYLVEIIARRGGSTQLILRDVTPPPSVPGLTEAQRWERVGMKPDGGLANPLAQE